MSRRGRDRALLRVPGWDRDVELLAYGHYGRPLLWFPTENGSAVDAERNGVVDAVGGLLEAGRLKLYCVGSLDDATWSDRGASTEDRARRYGAYEALVTERVVPWVRGDCGGDVEVLTAGASLGAYHAVHLALRRADLFPLAIGLSGNYDPASMHGWGERGEATYFADPLDYVPNLHGGHLDWLRSRLTVLLVVGQGAWETHPTRSLPSTRAMAEALRDKGIRCELDVWGEDVAHDWPWWCAQVAHHLPRFC